MFIVMNRDSFESHLKKIYVFVAILIGGLSTIIAGNQVNDIPLRRPMGPDYPMLIVHFNVWDYPDPYRSIDLIPEDIRPYAVFCVALSQNDNWVGKDHFSICESWVRACAQKGVWVQIQVGIGGRNHFSETALDEYEYFYKNYPNFIGYSWAEQSIGYSVDMFQPRLDLWARLLELSHQYGGTMMISDSHSMNGSKYSPIARLKANKNFEEACKKYKNNLAICEKYTMSRGYYDQESICLGTWLSGHAGHYGFRYDICGWNSSRDNSSKEEIYGSRLRKAPDAVGGAVITEHFMLTGQTITDGPETVGSQCIKHDGIITLADGYQTKKFFTYSQYRNMYLDQFRKVIDGTVRIPTQEEVYERTKVAMVNDIGAGDTDPNPPGQSSNDRKQFNSLQTLFTGLYANEGDTIYGGVDGFEKSLEWNGNSQWFKQTGRYPSIPTMHKKDDYTSSGFKEVILHSEYNTKFPTQQDKVDYFNSLFPEKYTGNLYADRINNSWISYHNDLDVATPRTASIPFVYNTCEKMELVYSFHAMGVINEYKDYLQVYLNNYCSKEIRDKGSSVIPALRENTIKIYGSKVKPTYQLENRGDEDVDAPIVTKSNWENGIYTLTVKHNGPVDLIINCEGTATERSTNYVKASVKNIQSPPVYDGPYQYEVEDFEYKNIDGISAGANIEYTNYMSLGFLRFGKKKNASIRKTISVQEAGNYMLETRYSMWEKEGTPVDVYINGKYALTPVLLKTTSNEDWITSMEVVKLEAGDNTIEFRSKGIGVDIYFDNIIIEKIEKLVVSENKLSGFSYNEGNGPSNSKSFSVFGHLLTGNLKLTAPEGFELGINTGGPIAYEKSLTLTPNAGKINTVISVRLKKDLKFNSYSGTIVLQSPDLGTESIEVNGEVFQNAVRLKYDFTNDEPTDVATTPPALNVSVGIGNNATAGVVSYTDGTGTTSNVLKPYGGGQFSSTGVLNMDLFTNRATDYSVTWKLCTGADNYKIGVLLRGDPENVGDEISGYVQGIMHGYLFIVQYDRKNSKTKLRIHRSGDTFHSLTSNFKEVTIKDFSPAAGQPVWYRASVSGTTSVSLSLEYSTDNITWKSGASCTDAAGFYQQGATQFIWGLGDNKLDFYVDDIEFNGLRAAEDGEVGIESIPADNDVQVVKEEYYNVMGLRIYNPDKSKLKGFYIVRSTMSDGTIHSKKVYFK